MDGGYAYSASALRHNDTTPLERKKFPVGAGQSRGTSRRADARLFSAALKLRYSPGRQEEETP
jgi:hypothetical protein